MKKLRIRVCVPFYSEFEAAKPGLEELDNCKEIDFVIEARQGALLSQLRNSLINDGLSSKKYQEAIEGFDSFLMIGSDSEFTLADILKMISHDKPIVSLPTLRHESETEYICGWFIKPVGVVGGNYTTEKKGLHSVSWSSACMMLIQREVFKKTEYPWYRQPIIVKGDLQEVTSESIGFCMNVANSGYKIWCDFDKPVGHMPRNLNWSENKMSENKQPRADISKTACIVNKHVIFMAEQCDVLSDALEASEADSQKKDEIISSLNKKIETLTAEKQPPNS